MHRALVLSLCALALASVPAGAQSPTSPSAPQPPAASAPPAAKNSVDCPPGVDERSAPSLGDGTTGSGQSLSRQLSESKGVICPPAGVDPGIIETPPSGGTMRVIPPPGPPGGERGVEPK